MSFYLYVICNTLDKDLLFEDLCNILFTYKYYPIAAYNIPWMNVLYLLSEYKHANHVHDKIVLDTWQ